MEELMDKNKSQDWFDWKIALIIFIIIKCVILTVNSEASDFNINKYIPGYDCNNNPEYNFINTYNVPLYRCGDAYNNYGQFIIDDNGRRFDCGNSNLTDCRLNSLSFGAYYEF
tara:strand:- start:88 stop:426 length:339 start_codon:yes stop_codon:yes gene_type:complete